MKASGFSFFPARATRRERLVCSLLTAAGAVLLLDALVLMAKGHFNLGVIVPAVLGTAGLLIAWKWAALQRWRHARPGHRQLWAAGWAVFTLWLASLLIFWSRLLGMGLAPAQVPPVQAIVVLGSATLNGKPRPPLAERLDTAAVLARLQPEALIAVCGGVDWGEKESEAEIMARYLQQHHGIEPGRLVLEKLSTSTELNLKFSRPLLAEHGVGADAPMAIVSSDFHLMRVMAMARRQGLADVHPVAAPTPPTMRFNAWLREYFAMASSWVLGEV